MRHFTSMVKKEEKIPAGLVAIMLAALAVGIFAAGCLAGLNASRITPHNGEKVNFHEIHYQEHVQR